MSVEQEILENSHVIAVVGLSDMPDRASNQVARYLQANGYKIIPVNPNIKQALDEKAYPDLLSVPEPVDVVNIFRKSEDVPPVVEQAIKIKAKAVWMQLGIVNEEAARRARSAGLKVVMDKCMRQEHFAMK